MILKSPLSLPTRKYCESFAAVGALVYLGSTYSGFDCAKSKMGKQKNDKTVKNTDFRIAVLSALELRKRITDFLFKKQRVFPRANFRKKNQAKAVFLLLADYRVDPHTKSRAMS